MSQTNNKQMSVGELLKTMKSNFAAITGQQNAAIIEEFTKTFDTMAAIIGEQQTMIYKLQNTLKEYEGMMPPELIQKISETQKAGGNAKVVLHDKPSQG